MRWTQRGQLHTNAEKLAASENQRKILANPRPFQLASHSTVSLINNKLDVLLLKGARLGIPIRGPLTKREENARPEHATRDDVERAVESLSKADELRLEKYAKYKVRGLGRKAMNRDYEDLLQEAFKSTCIGAEDPNEGRRWRKTEVSFVHHMLGAMRSIAST